MVDAAARHDAIDSRTVGPIAVPKASDLLAATLREQILAGQLAEGHPLPTERELTSQTGLGRSSIREALRILEHQGFVTTRPGRNGGSVARMPRRGSVETSIDHFIRGQQMRTVSLLEVREAVEPVVARLAARNRMDADVARLESLTAAHEAAFADIGRFLRLNVEWHMAVAGATHNELLVAFISAISQALHAATDIDDFNSDAVRRATLAIHRRIVDAIRDGDEAAAERRMRRHVGAYVDLVGRTAPGSLLEPGRLE